MGRIAPLSRGERRLVRDEVVRWHRHAWTVHAVSVMPDHVHLLATPLEGAPGEWYALPEIMPRVKGRSSREVNRFRGQRGSLWQEESDDRITRGDREFDSKYAYILSNAGVAGLIGPLEEYDGFWCEGMERVPEGAKAAPTRPLRPRPPANVDPPPGPPLRQRIQSGAILKTKRRGLPHWQLAGASYFIVFCLVERVDSVTSDTRRALPRGRGRGRS